MSGISDADKEQFVNRCSEYLYTTCSDGGQVHHVFGGTHGGMVCRSLDDAILWAVYVNGGYSHNDGQR